MAEGKLQPADSGEIPLPLAKAPDFDLSDETTGDDGNGDLTPEAPETVTQGEPEGVFALFDREFPDEGREPIEPRESDEFDQEFSESFEHMFEAIKGDGSVPLFDVSGTPVPEAESPQNTHQPEAVADQAPENAEVKVLPIPKNDPENSRPPVRDISEELEELTLDDELNLDDELPGIGFEDADDLVPLDLDSDNFLSSDDEEEGLPAVGRAPEPETAAANGWEMDEEEALEEFNFDDSDDDELYDEDLAEDADDSSDGFDDFAKMALGFGDDDEDDESEISEDDDFKVEDLSEAAELDPFEEVAIMSSEDVAKYEPSFGSDELQFKDEEPLPEDKDPFLMDDEAPADEDDLEGMDPFGAEAAGAATKKSRDGAADDPNGAGESDGDSDSDSKKKGGEKKAQSGFKLPVISGAASGLLLLPWRLFSTATDFLFGVLESLLKILGKLPLIGLPFRLVSSVLSSIPPVLKRLLVLFLIVLIVWGGGAAVGSLFPKASASISLPDSGGAKFSSVELKEGKITGEIENTGDIVLQLFPQAEISKRSLFSPGTWFKPEKLGSCDGPLVEIPIDATVKVAYDCKVQGGSSVKPGLRE